MRRPSLLILASVVTLLLSACASTPEPPPLPIPDSSPLAKVKEGMGMKQVGDLMGQPTDTKEWITGKDFIPFYFGGDTARMIWYYKGVGRVTFSDTGLMGSEGYRVKKVEYDPNETGYSR